MRIPQPLEGLFAVLGVFSLFPQVAGASPIILESVASGSVYVYTPPRPSCTGTCEVNPFRIEVFREFGGQLPIEGLGLDERGVVEFDISALDANTVVSAEVVLSFNRYSNPSDATRTWDIAVYAGDGLLGLNDWGAGTDIVNGVPFIGEPLFSFDVTSALISHNRLLGR